MSQIEPTKQQQQQQQQREKYVGMFLGLNSDKHQKSWPYLDFQFWMRIHVIKKFLRKEKKGRRSDLKGQSSLLEKSLIICSLNSIGKDTQVHPIIRAVSPIIHSTPKCSSRHFIFHKALNNNRYGQKKWANDSFAQRSTPLRQNLKRTKNYKPKSCSFSF